MNPCDNLICFVDGELDADDAEAFRAHLRTCAACPDNLIEAVQLSAHLSTLPPPTPSTRVPAPPPPPAEPASIAMNPSTGGTATPVVPIHEAIKASTVGAVRGTKSRALAPPAYWKRVVGWSMGFAAIIAIVI